MGKSYIRAAKSFICSPLNLVATSNNGTPGALKGETLTMIKGRDNTAESLGPVLELIRLRGHSGLLTVERAQGSRLEEGEIYFQVGQPIYARTGQLSGQQALDWLLSWRQVYFTFLADQPRAANSTALAPNNSMAVATNVSALPRLPSPTFPRLPQVNASAAPDGSGESENGYVQNTEDENTATPGLEWVIPKKLGGERNVLSLPLTRPQRSIYMLVDGRRTISDLSRCTRKSTREIERLLVELREQGLISI